MDDTVAVALERRAQGVVRLLIEAPERGGRV
jgi:hypothetical protein